MSWLGNGVGVYIRVGRHVQHKGSKSLSLKLEVDTPANEA